MFTAGAQSPCIASYASYVHSLCLCVASYVHSLCLCVASYVYSLCFVCCNRFVCCLLCLFTLFVCCNRFVCCLLCLFTLFVCWLYISIGFICVLTLFVYWLHVCIGFISSTNQRSVLQYEWQFVFSLWFFDINLTCSSQYLETNTTQHKKPFFQSYCSSECKSSISRQNFPMREPMISHCVLSQKRWTHSD